MTNRRYDYTNGGRKYASEVECPVRGLAFTVTPPAVSTGSWRYDVRDLETGSPLRTVWWLSPEVWTPELNRGFWGRIEGRSS